MRKRRLWDYSRLMLLVGIISIVGGTGTVLAQTSSSSNYEVSETQFGAGSTSQNCSATYCAKASIGSMTSGTSKSPATTAKFGPLTPDEPMMEVIVEPGVSDLGMLTTEKTSTKTTNIKIRSYLTDGYTLQLVGSAPKYGNHTLRTSSTPTASSPGTEQFGINLANNTTPNVGADPLQIPSSQMSFGVVEDNYKTPNLFAYRSGDVVARSLSESGQTDYTISMVINVANSTPAGHFTTDFSAVVMPIY